MNTELFIARKLFFDKENQNRLSKRIINIALIGISLGLVVMLIAVSIVTGFKAEIRNKAIGFGGHIQITNFDTNRSYETQPINRTQKFLPKVKELGLVKYIQAFTTKPGIINTDEDIQGVILKGVGTDYNWDFFQKYLTEGRIPQINDSSRVNDVLISESLTKLLRLKLGDAIFMYFIQGDKWPPKIIQFKICGIYNTNLGEFDNLFVIGDIKNVQRLNDWNADQISGFEIIITDFDKLGEAEMQVRELVVNYNEEPGTTLRTTNIARKYPQLFDWLNILDMNVWVILTLMVLVAGFNMTSALLVLILERSSMIGILKALGSPDWSIRKVFLYLSGFLISRGLLWGNIIGLTLISIQKYLHLMHLDPNTYYVDVVPVNFSILYFILLNAGTMVATLAMLVVPSYFISKISPEKTIRFE